MNSSKSESSGKGEINIKVKDSKGKLLCFKLKGGTKLKKLMETYCSRHGFQPESVRFIYEGEVIKETDTPEILKMENNDEIDAVVEQHGGSGNF